MRKILPWLASLAAAVATNAVAGFIVYNAPILSNPALAFDSAYTLDMQAAGVGQVTAQVVYAAADPSPVSFTGGRQSTGSLTVVDYTKLSLASAVNSVTVVNNSASAIGGNTTLVMPGVVLKQGVDWVRGNTASDTARSIAAAFGKLPNLSVTWASPSSVVSLTASPGSAFNSLTLVSSTQAALSVLTPTFTGGQDNAVVQINAVALTQGAQWTAGVSNAATAASLAAAVNASSALNQAVLATPAGASVNLSSRLNSSQANYPLLSSTPANLATSGAAMTGGVTSQYSLATSALSVPSHGLTTALPVLYDSGASPAIGGLSSGTTYYAIALNAGSLKLATSKTNALTGAYVVLTSSTSSASLDSYSLTALPLTGTPSFKWQVSSDGLNWNDLNVSSVTMVSLSTTPTSVIYPFGYIGTRYLRQNVVAPTTGGVAMTTTVTGTN